MFSGHVNTSTQSCTVTTNLSRLVSLVALGLLLVMLAYYTKTSLGIAHIHRSHFNRLIWTHTGPVNPLRCLPRGVKEFCLTVTALYTSSLAHAAHGIMSTHGTLSTCCMFITDDHNNIINFYTSTNIAFLKPR